MNDEHAEHLSAYADGELESTPSRFVAKRLRTDDAARQQLGRYHAMSAAMRNEYAPGANQMADRVQAALAKEPAHTGRISHVARRLTPVLQPLGGLAIAASVALGLVTAWPMLTGPVDTAPETSIELTGAMPALPSANGLQRVDSPANASVRSATAQSTALQQRLNTYWVNHSEHAAGGRLGGTLKYARIVGHDPQH